MADETTVLELFIIVDQTNDGGEEIFTKTFEPTPENEVIAQELFEQLLDVFEFINDNVMPKKIEMTLQTNKNEGEEVIVIDEYILTN